MRILAAASLALFTLSVTPTPGSPANADHPTNTSPQIPEASVFVSGSFMTAKFLHDSTPSLREFYIAGVVDGMGLGVAVGAPEERVKALDRWRQPISMGQLAAIVVQYLNQHPEEWHYPAHVSVMNAVAKLGRQHGFFR